jgi:hypothetical protein
MNQGRVDDSELMTPNRLSLSRPAAEGNYNIPSVVKANGWRAKDGMRMIRLLKGAGDRVEERDRAYRCGPTGLAACSKAGNGLTMAKSAVLTSPFVVSRIAIQATSITVPALQQPRKSDLMSSKMANGSPETEISSHHNMALWERAEGGRHRH